jgi:hypothetical protein
MPDTPPSPCRLNRTSASECTQAAQIFLVQLQLLLTAAAARQSETVKKARRCFATHNFPSQQVFHRQRACRVAFLRSRKRSEGVARRNRYTRLHNRQHQQLEQLRRQLQHQRLLLPLLHTLLWPVKCWSIAWARRQLQLLPSSQRKQLQKPSNRKRRQENLRGRGPSPKTNRRRNFELCKRGDMGVVLVNVTVILKRVAVDIRAADSFCILRGLEPKDLATSKKQLLPRY